MWMENYISLVRMMDKKTTAKLMRILKIATNQGGIHIVGNKQVGKSNLKKLLASTAIKSLNTQVIICDTVGIWKYDFDKIGYYTIPKGCIRCNRKAFKIDETIKNEVIYLLNDKKPIIFDLELEFTDQLGFFDGFIMSYLYDKQRNLTKIHKKNLPDSYLIIIEEAQNVFGINFETKMAGMIRKKYNELANYKIGIISSSQALTEVNAKFRRKMALFLIGKSSLTDYSLTLEKMLKHSQYKESILDEQFRFKFLDTSNDSILQLPLFKSINGEPFEIKQEFLQPKQIIPQIKFDTNISLPLLQQQYEKKKKSSIRHFFDLLLWLIIKPY